MFSVIMAGGSGTRFWPASRKLKPKQFLDIAGPEPMIVETCNRLSPVSKDEEMIFVLGHEHLADAKALFSGRPVHMVAEPVGRNTAPCMGLGAVCARKLGCSEPVAFLPADHYIADPSSFLEGLVAAARLAESGGIVTLGIVPSRPETGYGYIRRNSERLNVNGQAGYEVSAFVEKPDLEDALSYLRSGEYYWNAGIFVATPEVILNEINELLPDLSQGLQRLEQVWGTKAFETELVRLYNDIDGISFDYGIMEKTREKVFVIPCECGWSDVGSWLSLYKLKTTDQDENQNLVEGPAFLIDCEGNFVSARGNRQVHCLGLKNLLIVDSADTLLVTDLDRSQDIRMIVDLLKKTGQEELL